MFCNRLIYVLIFLALLICKTSFTQKRQDTLLVSGSSKDTSTKSLLKLDTSAKKFSPRIATLRSALIPGWGQAYNKKYWKIPIIYGALGTTAGIYFYNIKTYKLLRKAYIYRTDNNPSNDTLIDKQFQPLSAESIRSYRNSYRQNIDYSVLFFLAFWALNVVDATVDAHLKSFDVNDNISFKVKPDFNVISKVASLSFAFDIHQKHFKSFTP